MTAYAGTVRYQTGGAEHCTGLSISFSPLLLPPPSPAPTPLSAARWLFLALTPALSYLIFTFSLSVTPTNYGFPMQARAWLGQPFQAS